ncbi:MAG: urate oxidase [Planctomycetota bacterium]
MSAKLISNAYGKSLVRLTHVTRHPDRHELKELAVAVQLEGDFAAAYLTGDNRQVVATDSMKNTVYVLAKTLGVADIESFGLALARHFLHEYAHVTRATIRLDEQLWRRIAVEGNDHPHAFVGGGSETRLCTVTATRSGVSVQSGLDGLLVLKTTDSGFADFYRDRFATLPDTDDRIFATIVAADWTYREASASWDECHRTIRQALLNVFATHKSLGVQQTLFAMGEAALDACAAIDEIRLVMPNKHRIPVNLRPFGLDNPNEVFMPTDEPHGLISGTIRRG